MRADLHVHSSASDGTVDPDGLVRLALSQGLTHLALADHDTVAGVDGALECASHNLAVIPAVELSAQQAALSVHILGYFVDHHDERLLARLAAFRDERRRRAHLMIQMLAGAGHPVTVEHVIDLAGEAAVGRVHLARALVDAGSASSISDAFARLIGRDCPFYVARTPLAPCDAVAVIHDAGGLAVLAHPGVTRADDLIDSLAECGLDGIEAFHADHTAEQCREYERRALAHGLLVTGGSDFHGLESPHHMLGAPGLTEEHIEALLLASKR